MKEIPIGMGKVALVDDEDFDELASVRWYATTMWTRTKVFVFTYATRRSPNGLTTYMHRVIMDAPDGVRVDHKNGDTLDNRRTNLRLATAGQNSANGRPSSRSSSGYRGVSREPSGRWLTRVYRDRKLYYRGGFATAEAAARAYDTAAREVHGEFAHPNFPN